MAIRLTVLGIAAMVMIGAAGCGGDDGSGEVTRLGSPEASGDPTASSDPEAGADPTATSVELAPGETEQTVAVTLEEWSVTLDTDAVDAGVVEFVVTNSGSQPHELVVVRSDADATALEVVDQAVPEDAVDFRGEVEPFPAGETAQGSFRLEAGRYLLFCNLPGHYEQGIVTEFTVR